MTASLHCAGCGCEGRAPTVAKTGPRPVLRPVFVGSPAKAELRCELCAAAVPSTTRRAGQ